MPLLVPKILIGFSVGTLVGLTGLGGGVLMLPLLIFGLQVPPVIAVGSDAVFNSFTKVGAGLSHWKQGHVNWRIVGALAAGSIPGTFAGVAVLSRIRAIYGEGVNDFLRVAIGVLLLVIPTLLLFERRLRANQLGDETEKAVPVFGIGLIGLFAGFLVGLTSVGSGSVIMLLLLLFCRFSPAAMVGTDIVHAVVLTGVTGLLHFRLGTVDPILVTSLLIGSIPGGLLGSRLSQHVPGHWLRRILYAVLLATGARMVAF